MVEVRRLGSTLLACLLAACTRQVLPEFSMAERPKTILYAIESPSREILVYAVDGAAPHVRILLDDGARVTAMTYGASKPGAPRCAMT